MKNKLLHILVFLLSISCAAYDINDAGYNIIVVVEDEEEIELEIEETEELIEAEPDVDLGYLWTTPGDRPIMRRDAHFRRLQLALTRICVSEAGFQYRTMDCRLIYEVLTYWSADHTTLTMGNMRRYSGKTFDRDRTDHRRWIAFLNSNFSEPTGWRESQDIPWSSVRDNFRRLYNYVGYLIRYPQPNPCTVELHHWGARGFRRREHLGQGWILVQCDGAETLNDFWSLPRRNEYPWCVPGNRSCNFL